MHISRISQAVDWRALAPAIIVAAIASLVASCHGTGTSPAATGAQAPTPARATSPAAPGAAGGAARGSFTTHSAPGYVAHLHVPSAMRHGRRAPAVLLLGGSGGSIGWQDYMAELLAQRGIAALAVAYFAYDSLPRELDRIPLEAFDDALTWLASQPSIDRRRLGIGGVSKGSEAALLVAAAHPELRAVGVFTPSAFVFQSVTADYRRTSSWARHGVEVPYIPYGAAPRGSAPVEFYRAGVREADSATRAAAAIPVERIGAPLLMLSGRDDLLWGSGSFADMLAERLAARGQGPRANPVENIVYPDAGHLISTIRPDDVTARGGTKAGNDFAQRDGQQRFLDFFEHALVKR